MNRSRRSHSMERIHIASSALAVALICFGATIQLVSAEDWPHFRGPNCTGISSSQKPLPVKFSSKENVRWSAKVGDGVGCPVVAAGRVFVCEMVDAQTVALTAYKLKSGKRLWQRKWKTGDIATVHKTNSHASTTPAADAERVYFYFSSLGMMAVDAKNGKDVWNLDLPEPSRK